MRNRANKRRGTVAVIVAPSLVAVLSVVALALDGGILYEDRRDVQAATDAAALAAADDLFNNYGVNNGLDPSGTAAASARSTAAANGFNNSADADSLTDTKDAGNASVTVNIPPASGPFTGKAGYAEVIIKYYQKRGFSSIFGSGNLPVTARAVARGNPGSIGILVLDPVLAAACEIDGTVNILNNGVVDVDSKDTTTNDSPLTGACYVASTSHLSTGGINVVGDLNNLGSVTYTSGGTGLNDNWTALPDPLAKIPEPTTTGLTTYASTVTITTDTTLQPGVYTNIIINAGAIPKGAPKGTVAPIPTVTMAPGLYYFANKGSLQLNAGTLQGTGVMFFDNTSGDSILNKAGGLVTLSAPTPTSGGTWPTGTTSSTYNGISFWIPRAQTKEVHIETTYNLTISGTFYAQAGEFDFRPDGASVQFNTGNYICDQAEWGQGFSSGGGGTSNGTININPGSSAPSQRPLLVE